MYKSTSLQAGVLFPRTLRAIVFSPYGSGHDGTRGGSHAHEGQTPAQGA